MSDDPQETGVGPAPPETVALWVKRVATMRADEVDEFERHTFTAWDQKSLGDVRRTIDLRRRKLGGYSSTTDSGSRSSRRSTIMRGF